jgi:beta-lactamase class A
VRRPRRGRTSFLVLAAALACTGAAHARFGDTLAAAQRAVTLPRTAEGEQSRYDAGRNLEEAIFSLRPRHRACSLRAALTLAQGLIREAEGYDRPLVRLEGAGRRQAQLGLERLRSCPASGDLVRLRRRPPRWTMLPQLGKAAPEGRRDAQLSAEFERIGRAFPGWAAVWTHDLVSGRTAGWNSDAQFPAASTVKLAVLIAALQRGIEIERNLYDLRAMTGWSSNLAANRLFLRVGGRNVVEAVLHRIGARRSTYPQGFRVGTAATQLDVQKAPPLVSGRVTTAHDLGRLLYVLHAGALGNQPALRRSELDRLRSSEGLSLLLDSEPKGNNVGLLRPWLPARTPIAQKNGWLHDARHTAAIVYFRGRPRIVVVLTYAPNLPLSRARSLGRDVVAAVR